MKTFGDSWRRGLQAWDPDFREDPMELALGVWRERATSSSSSSAGSLLMGTGSRSEGASTSSLFIKGDLQALSEVPSGQSLICRVQEHHRTGQKGGSGAQTIV